MAKRILDCFASDFESFTKEDLLESIRKSEGRVIACETIGTVRPMLGDVTNAEFVSAMGADILLLNMFDVKNPVIQGLPDGKPEDTIRRLKQLTGRPIGINLEPVNAGAEGETDPLWKMSEGRRATLENARLACSMGVDMILLTGNPGMGVANEAIEETLKLYRENLGDKLILAAGKMHAAGVLKESAEQIITKEDVKRFRKAGADILLFPAPGTVPGITMESVRELVVCAHSLGALAITAIGTSQERYPDDPPDSLNVQNDRHGYSSSGRHRLHRHGLTGKYTGLFDCRPGRPAHLSQNGGFHPQIKITL